MAQTPGAHQKTDSEETPEDESIFTLSDQIVNSYQVSTFDTGEKQYLPTVFVERLLTPENIVKELDDKDKLEPEDLECRADPEKKAILDYILLQHAKTVFAILLVIGSGDLRGRPLRNLMSSLMRPGLVDAMLPITICPIP